MTNAELTTQTAYFTEAQTACRIARETGKDVDFQKAAAMLDSHRFKELPEGVQEDLLHQYSQAVFATGALQ